MAWFRIGFFLLLSLNSYAATAPIGRAYINIQSYDQVAVVDINTNTLLYKVNFPASSAPSEAIAITPDGKKVYVGCSGNNIVYQLNTLTNEITPVMNIRCFGAAITSKGIGYFTNGVNNRVIVLDTTTNQIVSTITSSQFNRPDAIFISKDETLAYVTNVLGVGTVTTIDLKTNTVINNAIGPTGATPEDIVVTPNNTKGYAACVGTNKVAFIDFTTQGVSILPYVFSVARYTAISPSGSTVYVGCSGSNFLSFIDTATNILTTNLLLSRGAGAIALNKEGSKLYVTSEFGSAGYVTVVDATTRSVITEISLQTSTNPNIAAIAIYDPDQNLRLLRAVSQYGSIKPTRGSLN